MYEYSEPYHSAPVTYLEITLWLPFLLLSGVFILPSFCPLLSLFPHISSCLPLLAGLNPISEYCRLILPLPVFRQVVEIALKVSPILGAHMFQPLLPAVFRGILDGEVSFTLTTCPDPDRDYKVYYTYIACGAFALNLIRKCYCTFF